MENLNAGRLGRRVLQSAAGCYSRGASEPFIACAAGDGHGSRLPSVDIVVRVLPMAAVCVFGTAASAKGHTLAHACIHAMPPAAAAALRFILFFGNRPRLQSAAAVGEHTLC